MKCDWDVSDRRMGNPIRGKGGVEGLACKGKGVDESDRSRKMMVGGACEGRFTSPVHANWIIFLLFFYSFFSPSSVSSYCFYSFSFPALLTSVSF